MCAPRVYRSLNTDPVPFGLPSQECQDMQTSYHPYFIACGTTWRWKVFHPSCPRSSIQLVVSLTNSRHSLICFLSVSIFSNAFTGCPLSNIGYNESRPRKAEGETTPVKMDCNFFFFHQAYPLLTSMPSGYWKSHHIDYSNCHWGFCRSRCFEK